MAYFLQIHKFKRHVQRQLDRLKDQEKGAVLLSTPSSRLSGDTTREDERRSSVNGNNDTQKSDDENGDKLENGHRIDPTDPPYASLSDITIQRDTNGKPYYQVTWSGSRDPLQPSNWSTAIRLRSTFILILIAFTVTAASSIDTGVVHVAAKAYGVSTTLETLASTGVFLIGFGLGALIASPASELFGRYPVYLGTLFIFACWLVGAALAPNIAAQIIFRFLAGLFGSAPLTVAGGSMSDMWSKREKTWTFPIFSLVGFGGPILGPVMSGYIPVTNILSFRWADWIALIITGLTIFLVITFKRETLGPRLLSLKAEQWRRLTGDRRFKSAAEASQKGLTPVFKQNFTRPFILAVEPIVLLFTIYLSIVYIVLFTFLDGYEYLFAETYGLNPGLSNLCFFGLLLGVLLSGLLIPPVMRITWRQLERDGDDGSGAKLDQESRLIFAMVGAPLIPIGLFWMGWTDYVSLPPTYTDESSIVILSVSSPRSFPVRDAI